jgi:hypothetical protein
MRLAHPLSVTLLAAAAALTACAAPTEEDAAASASGVQVGPSDVIELGASPCRALLERVYQPGDDTRGVRRLASLADVDAMLGDRDVVWPNHPTFADPSAPEIRVATVSLVTGQVTLFDLSTESRAVGDRDARVVGSAGARVRVARNIWQAQALLGGRLGRSSSVAETRPSFHLRGGASAVAQPASLADVDACFDGRQGMLVDDQGVPRVSLTPPAILRMWTGTYRNPYFSPPVAPDQWSRPAAPGTRHILAKFQLRGANGAMTDSSANSDYTLHEVPPTACYETGRASACGTNGDIASRTALLRAANDGDPRTDPAALASGWLHWSGGCINLHPDLGGGDAPDFRAFEAKMEEARRAGKPVYVVLSYAGLDQRKLLRDPRVTSLPTFGDGLSGRTAPAWYGALR